MLRVARNTALVNISLEELWSDGISGQLADCGRADQEVNMWFDARASYTLTLTTEATIAAKEVYTKQTCRINDQI